MFLIKEGEKKSNELTITKKELKEVMITHKPIKNRWLLQTSTHLENSQKAIGYKAPDVTFAI